ncbi:MAG TPA: hypothetical protein VMY98_07030 [Anaerolineae bacterium]|nr:hypothetical protein [Anaerolineae bacterium]
MEYTKILRRAWQITWRHKALWLFGFLLALASGGGGGGGGGRGAQLTAGPGNFVQPAWVLGPVIVLVVIGLVLIVASIIINPLSTAALIGMVGEIEETGATRARSGWRVGWSRFPRVLAIGLLIGIPTAIVAIVLLALGASPLLLLLFERRVLTVVAIALTAILMLLVLGVLIIGGVALSIMGKLAYRQCVLDKKGVFDSIRDGYRLGRKNLRQVGAVWLLLFGVDLATGIVMVPLALAVVAIAAVPGILVYMVTEAAAPAVVIGFPLVLLGILFLTVLAGIIQVARSATWTLAYLELQALIGPSDS